MTVPVEFKLNEQVATDDPQVAVRFPAAAPAKAGVYEFELIVVDDTGVASEPATVKVTLRGNAIAVVNALDANGRPVDSPVFKPGDEFALSAKGSKSENGGLKSFRWRLLARP
jgi:hypothetical protein